MCQTKQPKRRKWGRAALGVLVVATCLKCWTGSPGVLPVARAQIPDAGLQLAQLIAEARKANRLLGEIKALVAEHCLHEGSAGADNQSGKRPGKRRNRP